MASGAPVRGTGAQPVSEPAWRDDVLAMLRDRARAVLRADRDGFEATMAAAPSAFRRRKQQWLTRLHRLPLGAYSLAFARNGYDDLGPALDDPPDADEVHLVQVTERITLEGYDPDPATEDLFLTVVRRGARWSVVSDDDVEDLGLLSARNLWDFADVRRLERDGVMVVFHRDAATARRILDGTVAAVERVRAAWPLRWDGRVVVMIPRSAKDLGRILQTTFDLGPFVAFAASSVDRPDGEVRFTGHRVYVQPETFFGTSRSFQEDTLSHELVHVATRALSGAFVTAWIDEGVAQYYGERMRPSPDDLARRVRSGAFDGRLPEDFVFSTGQREEIRAAYEASLDFVENLAGRFGRAVPARLYRALGTKSAVAFGTWRYHLDRAARDTVSEPFRDLERAWARRIERMFGG